MFLVESVVTCRRLGFFRARSIRRGGDLVFGIIDTANYILEYAMEVKPH